MAPLRRVSHSYLQYPKVSEFETVNLQNPSINDTLFRRDVSYFNCTMYRIHTAASTQYLWTASTQYLWTPMCINGQGAETKQIYRQYNSEIRRVTMNLIEMGSHSGAIKHPSLLRCDVVLPFTTWHGAFESKCHSNPELSVQWRYGPVRWISLSYDFSSKLNALHKHTVYYTAHHRRRKQKKKAQIESDIPIQEIKDK